MISNSFGDRGIDRHGPNGVGPPDGILQDDEIDIKKNAAIGGFGLPISTNDVNSDAISLQQPMFGGCFDTSGPTPKYLSQYKDRYSCLYDNKSGNTWSHDSASDSLQCKNSSGSIINKNTLTGDNYIVNKPTSELTQDEYKINCEYTKPGSGYLWNPDYLRPNQFKDKTLSDVLENINNGRVSDIDIFDGSDTIKPDIVMNRDNQETSVKGIVEETALSKYFFSEENIDAIQQTLRYRVYKRTNKVIDKQSDRELYIVMRSVLLQHANFKVKSNELINEIHKLNSRVIDYCVGEVSSNVLQYQGYINDLQHLPIPLDRPGFDETGSRNRSYDLSNHIAPIYTSGFGSRHQQSI